MGVTRYKQGAGRLRELLVVASACGIAGLFGSAGPALADRAAASGAVKATASAPAAWRPLLGPRHVALPAAEPKAGVTNPIDRLLTVYYAAHKIPPAPPVDDRAF